MDIETTKPVSQILSIRKNKPIMVLFYMKGCHFCGLMKESWNNFKQNSPINHGEVGAHDMAEYNPVSNEESIRGFPTLRLYNKGKLVKEYEGEWKENKTYWTKLFNKNIDPSTLAFLNLDDEDKQNLTN